MRNGSKTCTIMDCWRVRFDPKGSWRHCARCCVIADSCWNIARRTCCTCKRRCCRPVLSLSKYECAIITSLERRDRRYGAGDHTCDCSRRTGSAKGGGVEESELQEKRGRKRKGGN